MNAFYRAQKLTPFNIWLVLKECLESYDLPVSVSTLAALVKLMPDIYQSDVWENIHENLNLSYTTIKEKMIYICLLCSPDLN